MYLENLVLGDKKGAPQQSKKCNMAGFLRLASDGAKPLSRYAEFVSKPGPGFTELLKFRELIKCFAQLRKI